MPSSTSLPAAYNRGLAQSFHRNGVRTGSENGVSCTHHIRTLAERGRSPTTTYLVDADGRTNSLRGWGACASSGSTTGGTAAGGGEVEVAKSGMSLSGSGTCYGWDYALAKDGLTADPGWIWVAATMCLT